MKTIELLDKLRARAVFRIQDVERIASCGREYAKLLLNRLKARGYVKKVARNAYTTKDDIFVIASNITSPSYISFWSASRFMGYTEQMISTVFVATTRKSKPVKFGGYVIEFVPMKHFFGYRKTLTSEGELFVAEDEKLLIDAFLRPEKCGNFGEIEKMFGNAKVDEGRMVSYLERTGSQTVIKRVGFLLEKARGIDLSGHFRLDRNYVPLDPFSGRGGKRASKWRVRV